MDLFKFKDKNMIKIPLIALGIWFLTILALMLLAIGADDQPHTLGDVYMRFVSRWDSNSFVQIARDGYVLEGDQRYLIAFLPLYPYTMRFLHLLTGMEVWLCGVVISTICGQAAALVLYRLLLKNMDREDALFGVILFLLYPFSFFMMTGMSESMYLLFLFLTVYYIREEKYIISGVFAFLTTLTRLPGLSVGIVMFCEFAKFFFQWCKKKDKVLLQKLLKLALAMLMALAGFAVYMQINHALFGDPLQFMKFQQENWSQHMTSPIEVFKTAIMQLTSADSYGASFTVGVGAANLFAFFVFTAGLVWCLAKKNWRDAVYQALYSFLCLSASWLLSGARYTLGAYPIFEMQAALSRKHKTAAAVVYAVFYLVMCWFYYQNAIY
ncbi:MAG: hypothetical protein J6D00_08820 [Christensenellaceae bacterium]|nr:hypothetical protein [Christensenellaceae bacterium]